MQEDVLWYDGKTHIGCIPLGDAVDEKKPVLHFCGHLHSCTHEPQQRGETTVTNVSVVNEHYNRVYEPRYLEI
jgi:Icc-related predicted phosphoesterase